MATIPEGLNPMDRSMYCAAMDSRRKLKQIADEVASLRQDVIDTKAGNSETVANVTLAYRHIEDASMRLGKMLQSLDGGVSVYDRETTPEVMTVNRDSRLDVREIGTPRELLARETELRETGDGRHEKRAPGALGPTKIDGSRPIG